MWQRFKFWIGLGVGGVLAVWRLIELILNWAGVVDQFRSMMDANHWFSKVLFWPHLGNVASVCGVVLLVAILVDRRRKPPHQIEPTTDDNKTQTTDPPTLRDLIAFATDKLLYADLGPGQSTWTFESWRDRTEQWKDQVLNVLTVEGANAAQIDRFKTLGSFKTRKFPGISEEHSRLKDRLAERIHRLREIETDLKRKPINRDSAIDIDRQFETVLLENSRIQQYEYDPERHKNRQFTTRTVEELCNLVSVTPSFKAREEEQRYVGLWCEFRGTVRDVSEAESLSNGRAMMVTAEVKRNVSRTTVPISVQMFLGPSREKLARSLKVGEDTIHVKGEIFVVMSHFLQLRPCEVVSVSREEQ